MIEQRLSDNVADLILNRPARHNALVPDLLDVMHSHLRALAREPLAGLIVSGNGPSFSTGGDIRALHHEDADYANTLVRSLNDVIVALLEFPAPVVCAAHGWLTGGSLGLLLAADYVVASRSLCIAPYYDVVGFSPDGGWQALLPGRIGEREVAKWIRDNDRVDAERATKMGLAHEVTTGNPAARAREILTDADTIIPRRHTGMEMTSVRRSLDDEREAFVRQFQTPIAKAGMQAFLRGRA